MTTPSATYLAGLIRDCIPLLQSHVDQQKLKGFSVIAQEAFIAVLKSSISGNVVEPAKADWHTMKIGGWHICDRCRTHVKNGEACPKCNPTRVEGEHGPGI